MKLEGSQDIAADRATVWAALNDPAILEASIPGCQELEMETETRLHAKVKQKIGPVSATFDGVVELTDINPPESYHIAGEGKGGAAGFAKGGADVKLEEIEGGTRLIYHAEAKVGGKLAQLGSRLIDGVAHKLANQFFENFKNAVEGPAEAEPEAQAAAEPAEDTAQQASTAPDAAEAVGEEPEKKGFWKKLFS
jgi:carbon monoxide dehydrogenase subunit G